jgi:hypothetical protein
MVEFCRVEYEVPEGWVLGHNGVGLVDPATYADRLAKRGVSARVTVLGPDFQPVEVFTAAGDPAAESVQPLRVLSITECAACGTPHSKKWECIL